MLKQRIMTALILAPLAIWGMWALPEWIFSLIMMAVVLIGAWEWTRLSQLDFNFGRVLYVMGIALVVHLVDEYPVLAWWFIDVSMVWWLLAAVFVMRYPRLKSAWDGHVVLRLISGALVLVPFFAAVDILRHDYVNGAAWLIFTMCLVWAADTGAYFAGRQFGKRKLAPNVSPGKTWEGVAGGLVFAGFVLLIGQRLLDVDWSFALIAATTLSVIFSVYGDLLESLFKRVSGHKDSGAILPGHGGVLDRVDGLTAALPIFVFVYQVIQ